MTWETAISIARTRARLMQESSLRRGAMASVFRLSLDRVASLCASHPGVVCVASDVAKGQTLISGEGAAVDGVCDRAHKECGKRPFRLPISIAAHSPLMESAREPFLEHLEGRDLGRCLRPVWSCLDGETVISPVQIRQHLVDQLTHCVHWRETIDRLINSGVSTLVGVGPSLSLLRQVERSNPGIEVCAAADPDSVEDAAARIRKIQSREAPRGRRL